MAGITGLGTTYNLPNFTGILHQLTPAETPFFSAIGGLTGGGQTTSPQFEWEGFDLRDPGQNVALEGATAPTAQNRVRAGYNNIVQLHHETVSVSYTKLAAVGAKAGINNAAQNPVMNELDWQTTQMLKQMVRDIEWSYLNGRYHAPSDNTEARRTCGLRQAITTNVSNLGTVVVSTGLAITASTDKITATSHGLSNGTRIYLRNVAATAGTGTSTGLSDTVVYYLVNTATNDFKLSLTSGGAAVDILADGTVDAYVIGASVPDPDVIGAFLQTVFDSGGISEQDTATVMANSTQKRAISKAYANAYGKFTETSRNVGGVNVTTLETDFGLLNIMLNRMMPKHEIVVASLEECIPVYEEIPGKGHFFAEPLAKTGANEQVQLYGETGLAYGSQLSHGLLTGLAIA